MRFATPARGRNGAFTLIEVVTALAILALVASSVWVVIDRCSVAAAESALDTAAFKIIRENMEKILTAGSVEEKVEYGTSDEHPDIAWESVIETFTEPATGQTWVRAICSAEYPGFDGEPRVIKLERWLTRVSDQQLDQLAQRQQQEEAEMAEQILDTPEDAAAYAGVDVDTLQEWVDDGLVTGEDGEFIKYNLDIYTLSSGRPSKADKDKQVRSIGQLAERIKSQSSRQAQGLPNTGQRSGDIDPVTGLTYEELEQMSFEEIFDLLMKKRLQ